MRDFGPLAHSQLVFFVRWKLFVIFVAGFMQLVHVLDSRSFDLLWSKQRRSIDFAKNKYIPMSRGNHTHVEIHAKNNWGKLIIWTIGSSSKNRTYGLIWDVGTMPQPLSYRGSWQEKGIANSCRRIHLLLMPLGFNMYDFHPRLHHVNPLQIIQHL